MYIATLLKWTLLCDCIEPWPQHADLIHLMQIRPHVPRLVAAVNELYEEKKHAGCDPFLGTNPRTKVPRVYVQLIESDLICGAS
jgi:hypothetical protein